MHNDNTLNKHQNQQPTQQQDFNISNKKQLNQNSKLTNSTLVATEAKTPMTKVGKKKEHQALDLVTECLNQNKRIRVRFECPPTIVHKIDRDEHVCHEILKKGSTLTIHAQFSCTGGLNKNGSCFQVNGVFNEIDLVEIRGSGILIQKAHTGPDQHNEAANTASASSSLITSPPLVEQPMIKIEPTLYTRMDSCSNSSILAACDDDSNGQIDNEIKKEFDDSNTFIDVNNLAEFQQINSSIVSSNETVAAAAAITANSSSSSSSSIVSDQQAQKQHWSKKNHYINKYNHNDN